MATKDLFAPPEPSPQPTAAAARAAALRAELHLHAHRYYVLDEPTIPDAESVSYTHLTLPTNREV